MKKTLFNIKKAASAVLSLAVLFTSFSGIIPVNAAGNENSDGTFSIYDGQVIAEAFSELNAKEKDILNCSALEGDVRVTAIPGDDDGLVKINSEAKTVVCENYTYDEYTWTPASATLVYTDASGYEVRESVALTNGSGSFDCPQASYRIEAQYDLNIVISDADQYRLLNTPDRLVWLVIGFNTYCMEQAMIDEIAANIELLYKLTTGEIGTPNPDSAFHKATVSLYNECKANGNQFVFSKYLDEYEKAANPLKYLIENGEIIRNEARSLCSRLYDITYFNTDEDKSVAYSIINVAKTFASLMNDTAKLATLSKMEEALTHLKGIEETLREYNEDTLYWRAFDEKLIRDGVTDEEYAALNTAVQAAIGRGGVVSRVNSYENPVYKQSFLCRSARVMAKVDQFKVNVTISAAVIDKSSVNSSETTSLADMKVTLVLDKGVSSQAVLSEIAKSGAEAMALSSWESYYKINRTNYVRSVSGLTDTLMSDIDVTISYTPKNLNVSYAYADDALVPFGYNLKLEAGGDVSYDYTVNGERKWENTVVCITKATEIDRIEGKKLELYSAAQLAAKSEILGISLTEYEKNVLLSDAFVDSELWLRIPETSDSLVISERDGDTVTVRAETMLSGLLSDAEWVPYMGNVIGANGKTVAQFTFENGEAEITASEYERIDVEYKLTVPEITESELNMLLSLPSNLRSEVLLQLEKTAMLMDDEAYEAIGKLDGEKLEILLSISDGYRQISKDAMTELLEKCVDKTKDEGPLYITDYIRQYREIGLSYYYTGDNYEKITSQYDIIYRNLKIVWEDPAFQKDLADSSLFEDYAPMLRVLWRELQDVELVPVDENIDRYSDNLKLLVDILEEGGEVSGSNASELVMSATVSAVNRGEIFTVTVDGVEYKGFAGESFEIETPELTADSSKLAGYGFDNWYSSAEGALADAFSAKTTVVIPEGGAEISSVYYRIGDANKDGRVNLADKLCVRADIASENLTKYNDVNLDGAINGEDSFRLKLIISGEYEFTA